MRIKLLPLLIAAITCSTSVSSHGQVVSIVDGVVWHEEYVLIEGGLTLHHSFFDLRTTGDTLIGGQSYVKLRQVGVDSVSTLGSSSSPIASPIDRYIASIRADEGALKWYVWFDGYDEELLLYNFDLSLGEELVGTWGDCSVGSTVTSIDSVIVADQWHRRFFLSAPYRYIIEGVGGSSGLFGYLCQAFEEYGCLNAYEVPSDELIVDGCGSLSTGIAPTGPGTANTRVYPNPTDGTVNLGPDAAVRPVVVYDKTGRTVAELVTDTKGSIDLSGLKAGLYLVKRGSATHRVMKF